jgi:hypothetical protein
MSLTIHYDAPSDSLHIDSCKPYAEQDSDWVSSGVVVRFRPADGQIENIELLSFFARIERDGVIELPVNVEFRLE